MKILVRHMFLMLYTFSSVVIASEGTFNFYGRVETDKLIYQPYFQYPKNEDGSSSFLMATTYLSQSYPAGYITSPEAERKIADRRKLEEEWKKEKKAGKNPNPLAPFKEEAQAAKDDNKSLSESTAELRENHKKLKLEFSLLRNKMTDNLKLMKGLLSQKVEIDIPKTDKKLPGEKKLETLEFSYKNFIACLKLNYPMLLNLLYFKHFHLTEQSTKLESLLSVEISNVSEVDFSGMLCGQHLGTAAFPVNSWTERAQLAQLFLKLSQDENAEVKSKMFLRQLIALRSTNSPVKGSQIWKYIWLRTSQLAYFGSETSFPPFRSFAQEFVKLEASGTYYKFDDVELRFNWKANEVEAHVSAGEKFANERLP